ncbi:HlyD family efflux transporter periplasmic adaptor subunit [Paractinoplanes toevensis]|uniref:Peptidoglycan-binding protein n=1 Tax=Paractinoplanes toevensis TaxID=571911 RepID=A0A919WAV5_9ACTN|nr:HlyD family efflux transporter periplasmic adaptor subunit [Actinoplanes toevensis]GIM96834.1 peptidoglycan-binding protein [Actinoplanes toevensis]
MRAVKVALALVVLAAGGFGAARAFPGRAAPAPVAKPSLTVATVTRADLADSRIMPGTLGYGAGVTVRGSGTGIVTQLPKAGTTVRRGKPLYRVDDQPVVVLFGRTPLFRSLDKPGLTGRDVAELRENLTLLGYASHRVRDNDVLDSGLLDAVHKWLEDLDLAVLSPARAVVLDGPGRVSALTARLGDPAAGDLFTVTGTGKVVTVPMSATDAAGVRVGTAVSVELPSGGTIPGVVASIATATEAGADPAQAAVTIKVSATKQDAAAVQVRFTGQVRKQVLTVPVGALVALREGGYAVQKRDGSLVPVKTGMFADGLVEVDLLPEGLEVVTTP